MCDTTEYKVDGGDEPKNVEELLQIWFGIVLELFSMQESLFQVQVLVLFQFHFSFVAGEGADLANKGKQKARGDGWMHNATWRIPSETIPHSGCCVVRIFVGNLKTKSLKERDKRRKACIVDGDLQTSNL